MLEETEARRQILDQIQPDPARLEQVPLDSALGRIACSTLLACEALPGFDNSQMDGYAVRAEDAKVDAELPVVGEQPAGADFGLKIQPGEALRIFTGAPMPQGADAVVMQEDVDQLEGKIRVREAAEPGEFVRRRGSDLCEGQKILEPGSQITAATLGVLASQGIASAPCSPRPICAVVSTGDELKPPESDLNPGEIYNSNGPMLRGLVRQFGGEPTKAHFHAPDDPTELKSTLEAAIDASDLCVIAGGVSVGDHDHVKATLADLGVEGGFWRVKIKPGKPLFFGKRESKLIFGLPGNPVSAHITFLLFVVSALAKLQGQNVPVNAPFLPNRKAQLLSDAVNDRGNRPHYLRGWLDRENGTFRPVGMQQSHALFSLSRANALIRIEPEITIPAGESARVFEI